MRFCQARQIGLEIVWVRQSERYNTVDSTYTNWPKAVKEQLKLIEDLPDYFDCPALDKRLVVDPEGQVYPCEIYHDSLLIGNVEEHPLEDLLNSPNTEGIHQMIKSRGCGWCQGQGEFEGNPKWMLMDCYRRQSKQALEVRGKSVEARYLPPAQAEMVINEILAPSDRLRPEEASAEELLRSIDVLRNRAKSCFL
jgi:hypothetical protein